MPIDSPKGNCKSHFVGSKDELNRKDEANPAKKIPKIQAPLEIQIGSAIKMVSRPRNFGFPALILVVYSTKSNTLRPYLAAVRSTLTAALTLENFSSQVPSGSLEAAFNGLIPSVGRGEAQQT